MPRYLAAKCVPLVNLLQSQHDRTFYNEYPPFRYFSIPLCPARPENHNDWIFFPLTHVHVSYNTSPFIRMLCSWNSLYIVFYTYIYIFLSNQTMRVESKRRTFCLIKNNKLLVFTRLGYIRAGMEMQLHQVSSSSSLKFMNHEDITVPRDPVGGGGRDILNFLVYNKVYPVRVAGRWETEQKAKSWPQRINPLSSGQARKSLSSSLPLKVDLLFPWLLYCIFKAHIMYIG